MTASTADNSPYVSIHGRRLGLVGDGTSGKGLIVDGAFVGDTSTRAAIKTVVTGHNGAGAITLTGAKVGDVVGCMVNLTAPADAKASFESVISVDGQIQQTSASNLSAANFLVELSLRS